LNELPLTTEVHFDFTEKKKKEKKNLRGSISEPFLVLPNRSDFVSVVKTNRRESKSDRTKKVTTGDK